MDRYEQANRIGIISLSINSILAVCKIIVGVLSSSSAMIADGFNSSGDVFSSIITLLGNRISKKPRDQDHPTGHGKAEYIFSGIIGLSLLLVAWNTLQNAIESLRSLQPISHYFWLLVVAGLTILCKSLLFTYCRSAGKTTKNPMIMALSEDHRGDIFLTSGTVIGIIGSYFGVYWMDSVIGILISTYIAYQGFCILKQSYHVLMDTTANATSPLILKITETITQIPGIDHIDSIVARPVGSCYAINIKISVPGNMTVLESHDITRKIKDQIITDPEVVDVIIHVNPMELHLGPSEF